MDETENIIQRLRLIGAKKMPCNDDFVKSMLTQSNPMIKQWAITAANQLKDQDSIDAIMQRILTEDHYYDVRLYALCYLARNNHPISISQIKTFLEHAVTIKQKSMIYNALAISCPSMDSLSYLQECSKYETDNDAKKSIEINSLKIAKIGLVESKISKDGLSEQFPEIYKKTKEGKIEKDILDKLREKQQAKLFDAQPAFPDYSETPEKSMSDIEEENYVNDLLEFAQVEFIQKRVHVRDLALVRLIKKGVDECKICGMNNIALDAHHLIPLKSGGADDEPNIICVCKNCHARLHANQIKKIYVHLYELTNSNKETILLNTESSSIKKYSVYSNHFFGHLLLTTGS